MRKSKDRSTIEVHKDSTAKSAKGQTLYGHRSYRLGCEKITLSTKENFRAVIHIFVFQISYEDVPVTISIMSDIYGNRNFLYLIVRRCSNEKVCFSVVAALGYKLSHRCLRHNHSIIVIALCTYVEKDFEIKSSRSYKKVDTSTHYPQS